MYSKTYGVHFLIVLSAMFFSSVGAQELPTTAGPTTRVAAIKPNYLPPSEILDFLGVQGTRGRKALQWSTSDGRHSVEIRLNDVANLLILSGEISDVDFVEKLIREADIAPRQIEIEVKIVEVSTSKARDVGIDWEQLVNRSRTGFSWRYSDASSESHLESKSDGNEQQSDRNQESTTETSNLTASLSLSDVLRLLDESGAATIRTAPRILTLNNRQATILDGQRVTYVTRYSSYTNLFETDSMDAGLTVSVLPSLGESGYITLDINAELTSLDRSISGSPVKDGQMVENTVIVKDGESVLLGGLTRMVEEKRRKRFPLLGHVLPFLFSREITARDEVESFIVLTPRVVDFSTALDKHTKSVIEGK